MGTEISVTFVNLYAKLILPVLQTVWTWSCWNKWDASESGFLPGRCETGWALVPGLCNVSPRKNAASYSLLLFPWFAGDILWSKAKSQRGQRPGCATSAIFLLRSQSATQMCNFHCEGINEVKANHLSEGHFWTWAQQMSVHLHLTSAFFFFFHMIPLLKVDTILLQ